MYTGIHSCTYIVICILHVHVHEHVQVPDRERCCGAGVEEVLPMLEGCGGLPRSLEGCGDPWRDAEVPGG